MTAFRIVQECLTNVLRHAGAGAGVDIRLREERGTLLVDVTDDGAGTLAGSGVGGRSGGTDSWGCGSGRNSPAAPSRPAPGSAADGTYTPRFRQGRHDGTGRRTDPRGRRGRPALIRAGFSMVLAGQDDIDVVGEAENGADALDLLRKVEADVVIMDIRMPVMDGIQATEQLMRWDAPPGVLVLTTFDNDEDAFAALRAGAGGFLLKNAPATEVVNAIRVLAAGSRWWRRASPGCSSTGSRTGSRRRTDRPNGWTPSPRASGTCSPWSPGAVQRRDRGGPVRRGGHGEDASGQPHGQTAPAGPCPGRRVRL
ncbi:hypothetical protein SHKM778_72790 [Streptomyces sp. KM77-8]|uniref:Response regulatory domain-containing protein n=1 Tax=Streptomyces haneummycinicus TaxID=3074435 RepID=A0AAT9HUI2_9ACTN